ncbi:hypothetical protein LG324_06685 [Phycicoccus jejuensis]|uniref:hypothetical protein n=1 Tax=Phycicoccus jejuensis TaxID=367299 RepID=UPI00384DE107
MTDQPLDTSRPFLGVEAMERGVATEASLRGPRFRRLVHGVYVDAKAPVDARVRAQAAMLVAPAATVVSRHTAAALWGGVAPDDWQTHVTTLRPDAVQRTAAREARSRARGGGPGCSAQARRLLEWGRMDVDGVDSRVSSDRSGITTRHGLRVTTPERTFLDCAEDLDVVELVVLGDSLVHAGVTTPDALVSAAASIGRYRRLARRAAALVRVGVDSAPESRTRMLLTLAGLPEPETDLRFHDADGTVLRRADMGYRRRKVSVEYDGRQHAEDDQQWAGDIRRREEFDGWGWRMVVVTSPGLWVEPETTVQRVATVLSERGERVTARSDEWRRYFGPRHLRSA